MKIGKALNLGIILTELLKRRLDIVIYIFLYFTPYRTKHTRKLELSLQFHVQERNNRRRLQKTV